MKSITWFLTSLLTVSLLLLTGCGGGGVDRLFEQAQQYHEAEDFLSAVETYEQIVERFPTNEKADDAQFMVGFIYANDIQDTTKAREAYQTYLDNYGDVIDDGMRMSAQFELENLGVDISRFETLDPLFHQGNDTTESSE